MYINLYKAVKECNPKIIIVNPISNCSYPGIIDVQHEENWWDGPIHESVESYGNPKKIGYIISECYRKQYGIKTINLIVSNAYGPNDYLDENRTHAMNGIILRMIKSQKNKDKEFIVWGSGTPVREWVYMPDVAKIIYKIISEEKYIHFPRNLFGHFCYQVYGNTPSVRNLIKERIKNGIKFKEEFYERAKGIRNKIGPYNSIHVRRNDFVEVHCESTNDQSNNLIQYLDNKLGKDLPLYIATDEKNKLFFKDVSERYKIYFNEDLFNGIDNKESIAIDQIMCIESEKFLGSMFSTFTNSINIQRGYEGKDDFSRNGINFTYQELEYERFPWEIENYDWTKIDKYFWINENS
jgi:hypothetical protein